MTDKLIEAVSDAIRISFINRCGIAPGPVSCSAFAAAAIAAIEAGGWAVVPLVPTDAMTADFDSAIPLMDGRRTMGVDGAKLCWDAMLAARPKVTP